MMRYAVVSVLGVSLFVAGCSGGKSASPRDLLIDRVVDGAALAARVQDLPGSSFDAMPTSGVARFTGVGELTIDRQPNRTADDLSIIGDVALAANFGRDTVTGSMDNLQGIKGNSAASLQPVDVNGTIAIGGRGSEIGGRSPNRFSTDYVGQIAVEGAGSFDINGSLNGQFVGTRATARGFPRAIKGLIADSTDLSARQGGQTFGGSLSIVAEQK